PHNTDRLHSPTHRTVQVQFESTDLGESEPASQHRPTKLGIGETIVPIPTLEAWVSRCVAPPHACEEGLECPINPVKDLMQYLAIYIVKIRSNLLTLHKGGRLFGKADALTCHAIGIPAMLEGSVIHIADGLLFCQYHARNKAGIALLAMTYCS